MTPPDFANIHPVISLLKFRLSLSVGVHKSALGPKRASVERMERSRGVRRVMLQSLNTLVSNLEV
jgi:hypothetical protein